MKKTLLAIALAAGTTLFAAPQATPAPEGQAPAKTTKTKKVRKARKHHKKAASTTNSAVPTK